MSHSAGIVLAGGRSSRMGTAKAALPWHGSTLLRRVTGIVARSVDGPVVVVRAPGQELPALDPAVEVAQDAREHRGPLEGLAAGLAAVADRADVVYVSSTDLPLLHPAFVRYVVGSLDGDVDVVLPEVAGHRQPLAAAYRAELLDAVRELTTAGRLRPAFLFERCKVLALGEATLRADPALQRLDPALDSVRNLNQPDEYESAHARPAPEIAVQIIGARSGPRRVTVDGWMLGGVAAAVGLTLDERIVTTLNGVPITSDPQLPLATGDMVAFMAAISGAPETGGERDIWPVVGSAATRAARANTIAGLEPPENGEK